MSLAQINDYDSKCLLILQVWAVINKMPIETVTVTVSAAQLQATSFYK